MPRPVELLDPLREYLQKGNTVGIDQEYFLPAITTRGEVIQRAVKLKSQGSGHDGNSSAM